MILQTSIQISPFSQKINYRTPTLFIGSCFASNIGKMMWKRKFPVIINPFGTVYNPLSVAQSLRRLRKNELFTKKDLIKSGDLFTTFFHHSVFSHPDEDTFLQEANNALQQGAILLHNAPFIVISLGTSWVYWHKASCRIVNNCHKIPASAFERKKLSVSEIVEVLSQEIAADPARTWIFTVSPIRHWKDGAHENQLSKANLLLAVEQLQQHFTNVFYFPAYEIMMDELRDYRFYAEDMLHPSEQAVEYIWERFAETAFDNETRKTMAEIEKIVAAQQHRSLHTDTPSYKQFSRNLQQKIKQFKEQFPFIEID